MRIRRLNVPSIAPTMIGTSLGLCLEETEIVVASGSTADAGLMTSAMIRIDVDLYVLEPKAFGEVQVGIEIDDILSGKCLRKTQIVA